MKKRIEVRNQAEFDACVKLGNIAVVINCSVVACGNSSVEACGNSSVEAQDNSSVEAWGNSSVVARDNSSVEARDNSSVEARGNSSVAACGNSSVAAWDNSSVEAWGNVFLRLFSALSIKASAHVVIMKHGESKNLEGGRQLEAAPIPKTGAEFCDFNGISQGAAFKVENIDSKIYESIESGKGKLDMRYWHGKEVNADNWCNTTHCRAGYAICLAGQAGFDLEKKYGAEMAGKMIYAVSRPDQELPDFHDSNESVMEELKKAYKINKEISN